MVDKVNLGNKMKGIISLMLCCFMLNSSADKPFSHENLETTPSAKFSISILSPKDKVTYQNQHFISVDTKRAPEIWPMDVSFKLFIDGKLKANSTLKPSHPSVNFTVPIERGTHTLQVQAYNGKKLVASSQEVTIYVHQASKLRR